MCCSVVNSVNTWLRFPLKKRVLPTAPNVNRAADVDVRRQNDDVDVRLSSVEHSDHGQSNDRGQSSDHGQSTGVTSQTENVAVAKSVAVFQRPTVIKSDSKGVDVALGNENTSALPVSLSSHSSDKSSVDHIITGVGDNNTLRTTPRRRVRDSGRERKTVWNPPEHRPATTSLCTDLTTGAHVTPTTSTNGVMPAMNTSSRRQWATAMTLRYLSSSVQSSTVTSRSRSSSRSEPHSSDKSSSSAAIRHESLVRHCASPHVNDDQTPQINRYVSHSRRATVDTTSRLRGTTTRSHSGTRAGVRSPLTTMDSTATNKAHSATSQSFTNTQLPQSSSHELTRPTPVRMSLIQRSPDKPIDMPSNSETQTDDMNVSLNDMHNIADISRFVSSSLSAMTSLDEGVTSSVDVNGVSINQVITTADYFSLTQARFPSKRNRLRCVRCVRRVRCVWM